MAVSFWFAEWALNAPAEFDFAMELWALGAPWTPSSCEELLKTCLSKFIASGSLKICWASDKGHTLPSPSFESARWSEMAVLSERLSSPHLLADILLQSEMADCCGVAQGLMGCLNCVNYSSLLSMHFSSEWIKVGNTLLYEATVLKYNQQNCRLPNQSAKCPSHFQKCHC